MYIPEEISAKYYKLPKRGKTEIVKEVKRLQNTTANSRFFRIMTFSEEPTPREYKFIVELVNEYYDFYFPEGSQEKQADLFPAPSSGQ